MLGWRGGDWLNFILGLPRSDRYQTSEKESGLHLYPFETNCCPFLCHKKDRCRGPKADFAFPSYASPYEIRSTQFILTIYLERLPFWEKSADFLYGEKSSPPGLFWSVTPQECSSYQVIWYMSKCAKRNYYSCRNSIYDADFNKNSVNAREIREK